MKCTQHQKQLWVFSGVTTGRIKSESVAISSSLETSGKRINNMGHSFLIKRQLINNNWADCLGCYFSYCAPGTNRHRHAICTHGATPLALRLGKRLEQMPSN
jgi:hypothetical protein